MKSKYEQIKLTEKEIQVLTWITSAFRNKMKTEESKDDFFDFMENLKEDREVRSVCRKAFKTLAAAKEKIQNKSLAEDINNYAETDIALTSKLVEEIK